LVLLKKHGDIAWIGGTRDDAAGEAFDKCARLLGLPYPGGPAISRQAEGFLKKNPKALRLFPRPIIGQSNFDWSFSGLKTAVLRNVTKSKPIPGTSRLAAEIQEAIVEVLVEKTLRAVEKFKPNSLLLAGGVAANQRLRQKFEVGLKKRKLKVDFRVPLPKLCTDNAAYIASFAFYNRSPSPWQKIESRPELTIVGQP
jgi:N6-L-threonylcarbamoyladenine synthase